jgi:hypothetical protein
VGYGGAVTGTGILGAGASPVTADPVPPYGCGPPITIVILSAGGKGCVVGAAVGAAVGG